MTDHTETWRPIPGWEGRYEASTHGRIRNVPRRIIMRNGIPKTIRPRILTPQRKDKYGHLTLNLSRGDGRSNNRMVHRLIAETFLGPRPDGMHVRHLNGDPTDNRPENLAYGTHSENMRDMVRHGRNNVSKTHCPQGHPYSGANLRGEVGVGRRVCRSCAATHSAIQRGSARREDFTEVADRYFEQFTGVPFVRNGETPPLPVERKRRGQATRRAA
ncbi:NUMOD4 motif-containing HNH endonuclease [Corynebacterium hansenii]|uniref:NUMOD4 motif-containing HNH endonuclease n=1 Tax=Corynebacterium hansenii TaxID=394964 RepID=A0ABV7ZP03_9CORY|nr:NUMOD4 motif-containing HNH endonuclease [Corynebacterium hansenii]